MYGVSEMHNSIQTDASFKILGVKRIRDVNVPKGIWRRRKRRLRRIATGIQYLNLLFRLFLWPIYSYLNIHYLNICLDLISIHINYDEFQLRRCLWKFVHLISSVVEWSACKINFAFLLMFSWWNICRKRMRYFSKSTKNHRA